ncbi:MAG: imidazolonepropionase [Pseudomonadota bacterium]
MWDIVWINARVAPLTAKAPAAVIKNGAIAVKDGRIAWLGPETKLPDPVENCARRIEDAGNCFILPGLIDCHTHLVYGGSRAAEFDKLLNGMSYAEIAAAGGGILSTVTATRAADEDTLYDQAAGRLRALMHGGVTALEIKSGYGLDTENEAKMLRVATRLRDDFGIIVQRSFLGAHALPPEYKTRADDYITLIVDEMLPQLAAEGLIDAVDGFCEKIGFSRAQMERIFQKAADLNLPLKLHAEQLSDQKGAQLAAEYKALSADHLEYIEEADIKAMAEAGMVAVLLPGAFYFLRETKKPPIELFRKYQVPMAISTDCNPGSSPATSIPLMMNMGCVFFRMTPMETLTGVTINAAKALGKSDQIGSLEIGKRADFALFDISELAELSYKIGSDAACLGTVINGAFYPRPSD